jgi:hypothetical protein
MVVVLVLAIMVNVHIRLHILGISSVFAHHRILPWSVLCRGILSSGV